MIAVLPITSGPPFDERTRSAVTASDWLSNRAPSAQVALTVFGVLISGGQVLPRP